MSKPQVTEAPQDAPQAPQDAPQAPQEPQEPESFPRAYVEELRAESASYRTKAKRAEELATALQATAIALHARGVLADPGALPWDEETMTDSAGLPDGEAIRAAAEALVKERPSLGRPQGQALLADHGTSTQPFSWGLLGSLV